MGFSFAPRSGSRESRGRAAPEPAVDLGMEQLGGPRRERHARTAIVRLTTARRGCPGTRFRGTIPLPVRITPQTGRLCAVPRSLSSYIFIFCHSAIYSYISLVK